MGGGRGATFRPATAAGFRSSKVPFCAVFEGILLGTFFLWGNHAKVVDLKEARRAKSERV